MTEKKLENINDSIFDEQKVNELDPKLSKIRDSVLQAISEPTESEPAKTKKTTKKVLSDKAVKKAEVLKSTKKSIFEKKKNTTKDSDDKMTPQEIISQESEQPKDKSALGEKEQIDASLVGKQDSTKQKRPAIFKILFLSILSTAVLLILVLSVGVYTFGWRQPVVKQISSYLYFPAGFYGYQPISLKAYWADIDTLTYFYQHQVEQGAYKEMPPTEEIQKIVWDRLLNMVIIQQLAKDYQVSVSPSDISSEIDQIVREAGSREKLAENLYEFYHWDIETFSAKVIGPFILEQRVWEKINADPIYDQAAQAEAQEILAQVKSNPEIFSQAASDKSDDLASAARGGDLGYFNQGVMVPEFEQAVFNLQVGEISDLVKTQFGYHIIRLDDKIVSETDPNDIQVKASHILIAPQNLNDILEKKKTDKKIIQLLDN